MNIKLELLSDFASDTACDEFEEISIYTDNIIDTTAALALSEIQKVLQNKNLSDSKVIEEFVLIFEKYHINYGVCHNFK